MAKPTSENSRLGQNHGTPQDAPLSPTESRSGSSTSRRQLGAGVVGGVIAIILAIVGVGLLAGGSSDTPEEITAPIVDPNSYPGDRENPFALNAPSAVDWGLFSQPDDTGWNIAIGPVEDITDAVLEHAEFNEPPVDGFRFAAFDVEMTLARIDGERPIDETAQSLLFNWEIVGGDSRVVYAGESYASECGSVPGELDSLRELYLGGAATGTVCIPIPAVDLGHPETQVVIKNKGERFYFSPDGVSPTTFDVSEEGGETSDFGDGSARRSPLAYGTETEITAGSSVWTFTVGERIDVEAQPRDLPFSEPEEGLAYFGINVAVQLEAAEDEEASPSLLALDFEVAGGDSLARYVRESGDTCGDLPEFDDTQEALVGERIAGTICIAVPEADLTHPGTRVILKRPDGTVVYYG